MLKAKYRQVFANQKSTEMFSINKRVRLDIDKPLTTCKRLKAAFGGIVVDTQRTIRKVKQKQSPPALSVKGPPVKKQFEEDVVESKQGKASNADLSLKVERRNVDSGHRFVVKRPPIPIVGKGFIYRPWLATDTDNASLTHGEESSGEEDTLAKEKQEMVQCNARGYMLEDVLGRADQRPMNLHL